MGFWVGTDGRPKPIQAHPNPFWMGSGWAIGFFLDERFQQMVWSRDPPLSVLTDGTRLGDSVSTSAGAAVLDP